jgi:hypothetical protein
MIETILSYFPLIMISFIAIFGGYVIVVGEKEDARKRALKLQKKKEAKAARERIHIIIKS